MYLNYGGIGSFIASEILLRTEHWRSYLESTSNPGIQCLIDQYNTYSSKRFGDNVSRWLIRFVVSTKNYALIFTIEQSGGELKLQPNIARNAGFVQSYYAYISWATVNKPEEEFPGLDFTHRQMFWMTLANTLCTTLSPDTQYDKFMFNEYTSNEYQVNGPLSNSVEFSKDFNCPVGSRMNPVNKCSFDWIFLWTCLSDHKIVRMTFYKLPETPMIELNKAFPYYIVLHTSCSKSQIFISTIWNYTCARLSLSEIRWLNPWLVGTFVCMPELFWNFTTK